MREGEVVRLPRGIQATCVVLVLTGVLATACGSRGETDDASPPTALPTTAASAASPATSPPTTMAVATTTTIPVTQTGVFQLRTSEVCESEGCEVALSPESITMMNQGAALSGVTLECDGSFNTTNFDWEVTVIDGAGSRLYLDVADGFRVVARDQSQLMRGSSSTTCADATDKVVEGGFAANYIAKDDEGTSLECRTLIDDKGYSQSPEVSQMALAVEPFDERQLDYLELCS